MNSKHVEYLILIGISVAFLNYGFAQQDKKKILCDGVEIDRYIRDVSDCRMWIRCKGANPPASGLCPDTYYFSEELQACTSRETAKCFICPDATSLSFEVVESSCNRYIRCIKGVPSEWICESGLQFNRNTRTCDFPSIDSCDPSNDTWSTVTPTTNTPETDTSITDTTTDISTTDTTNTDTTTDISTTDISTTDATTTPITTTQVTPSTEEDMSPTYDTTDF